MKKTFLFLFIIAVMLTCPIENFAQTPTPTTSQTLSNNELCRFLGRVPCGDQCCPTGQVCRDNLCAGCLLSLECSYPLSCFNGLCSFPLPPSIDNNIAVTPIPITTPTPITPPQTFSQTLSNSELCRSLGRVPCGDQCCPAEQMCFERSCVACLPVQMCGDQCCPAGQVCRPDQRTFIEACTTCTDLEIDEELAALHEVVNRMAWEASSTASYCVGGRSGSCTGAGIGGVWNTLNNIAGLWGTPRGNCESVSADLFATLQSEISLRCLSLRHIGAASGGSPHAVVGVFNTTDLLNMDRNNIIEYIDGWLCDADGRPMVVPATDPCYTHWFPGGYGFYPNAAHDFLFPSPSPSPLPPSPLEW